MGNSEWFGRGRAPLKIGSGAYKGTQIGQKGTEINTSQPGGYKYLLTLVFRILSLSPQPGLNK